MKVEISNIKIKVNKKQLTLSLAESKALFEKLNEIFGPKYSYLTYLTYGGTLGGPTFTVDSSGAFTATIDATNNLGINNLNTDVSLVKDDSVNLTLTGE